jgi:hypothetical protein
MKDKNGTSIEVTIAYLLGKVTSEIDSLTLSSGFPKYELTIGLAGLLYSASGREEPRIDNPVPVVRRKATKRSKTVAKVAVAGSSRSTTQTKSQVSNSGQKAYWAAMTPLQRKREWKRRLAKWPAAKRKKWLKGK